MNPMDNEALAEHERRILEHADGELSHELFASVTAVLPDDKKRAFTRKNFALKDPASEAFLEHSIPSEMAKADLSSKALCVDVYTSAFLKVEATAEDRKDKLVEQLIRANNDDTPPHKRGVCNDENYQEFAKTGLDMHDAKGCVFALSFYTGAGSNESSRGASLQVRKGNIIYSDEAEVDEFLNNYNHIIYYVSLALRSLPYYWGPVVRFVTMKSEAAKIYVPGNVVNWMQFSSTKKGIQAAASFEDRNVCADLRHMHTA